MRPAGDIKIQLDYNATKKKHKKRPNGPGYFKPDLLQEQEQPVVQKDSCGGEDEVSLRFGGGGGGFDEREAKEESEESVKSHSGAADWYFCPTPVLPEVIIPRIETKTPKKKKRCIVS